MSLLAGIEVLKNYNLLSQIWRGRVVFNEDPRKLGRVKCFIKGLFDTEDIELLPWIFQERSSGLGGSPNKSSFIVPEVGSEISVSFRNGDIHTPYYTSTGVSELTKPHALFDENYPESYGWLDSLMQWLKVNKTQKYVEWYMDSGFCIRVYNDGDVQVNIPKSLRVKIGGSSYTQVAGNLIKSVAGRESTQNSSSVERIITGSYGIQASGNIVEKAAQIHHNTAGTELNQVPGDVSLLQAQIDLLNTKVQELQEQADSIKQKNSEVAPLIAR